MGCSHSTPGTYPQIAKNLGFITPDQICPIAEAVVTTQRDNGNRTDRKQARLKYTVDRMGVDLFKAEVEKRSGITFAPEEPYTFTTHADRYGWTKNANGTSNLTLFIEHTDASQTNPMDRKCFKVCLKLPRFMVEIFA